MASNSRPRAKWWFFTGFKQAEAFTPRRFGVGSRFHFYITLPVAPAVNGTLVPVQDPLKAWRVLMVDNKPTARAVF
jgi:hypothetical protein